MNPPPRGTDFLISILMRVATRVLHPKTKSSLGRISGTKKDKYMWVGGSRSGVGIGERGCFLISKTYKRGQCLLCACRDQTWTFTDYMLLLCLSVVHPGPADFRVMPKEPRKTVHITEGRRKYYIRRWLVLNDPRLYCYTYEDMVCFKCSPQIFRLVRWHSHCHSVPFKINHCHFCENNNRILCNQNSLGSVQRQGTRLSPASNYKTIF